MIQTELRDITSRRIVLARQIAPPERVADLRRRMLPPDTASAIAGQEIFQTSTAAQREQTKRILMEYYLAGNQIFRMLIGEILEAYKQERLSVPMTHIVGKKKCGDTRVNAEGIATEAAISQVHESTAGNIVRRGHIFIAIPCSGFGMEEGHFD